MCERGARECRAGATGAPPAPRSSGGDGVSGDDGVEHQRGVAANVAGELLVAGGGVGEKKQHFDFHPAAVATAGSWLQRC